MSSRRRLRVVSSSDEEEDDDDVQVLHPPPPLSQDIETETLNLQDVSLNSSTTNPTNTTSSDPIPLSISDEDFIDASDHLSPPPPPPPPHLTSQDSTTSSVGMSEASDTHISSILEDLGLRLRSDWLESCLRGLHTAVPGFSGFDATKKAKLCFDKFLQFDMNYCGAGLLPDNVHQMHLVDLPGPFVLQVDEIVNISQPLRERYKKAAPGLKRCLKLSMTDGVQRVFGMEYQPIKDLDALAPAGLKVAISNVNIRHGLLMLVPEVFQVLGGLVEELDAARQRLVNEVNKPPRGKRTRTGVVPPLATRATRAAWPADDTHVSGPPSVNPVPQSATPIQVDDQGNTPASVSGRVSSNSAVPVHREYVGHPPPIIEAEPAVSNRRGNIEPLPFEAATESSFAMHTENASFAVPIPRGSVDATPLREEAVSFVVPIRRESVDATPLREAASVAVPIRSECVDATPLREEAASVGVPIRGGCVDATPLREEAASVGVPIRRERVDATPVTIPLHRDYAESLPSPVVISDDGDDVHMVAADENHPTFSGSSETPFTYLASLSVKWAASKDKASHVEGKIKCFITGVKGFQFKGRSTYELKVFVDDGSLISEILVDHNVVQKKIGYSPEEVNAALSSPDQSRVQAMKDTVKQFQIFLVNFEGKMVVRINVASPLPVATEMQQGCSLSDAWLLLRRLKSSSSDDEAPQWDPITISP